MPCSFGQSVHSIESRRVVKLELGHRSVITPTPTEINKASIWPCNYMALFYVEVIIQPRPVSTSPFQRPITETYGPLTRHVKMLVAHAPGMPGTFSPPSISKKTAG